MVRFLRMLAFILFDIFFINLSYIVAFLLRFEFNVSSHPFELFLGIYIDHVLIIMAIKIIILYLFGLYKGLWKYAGTQEVLQTVAASFVSTASVILYLVFIQESLPRSIYVLSFIFDILLISLIRLSYRFIRGFGGSVSYLPNSPMRRVMIVGAGDAGAIIIKELKNHAELKSKPVVLIDDNKEKLHKRIAGIPIAGNRSDIPRLAQKYKIDEIIIAIPSAQRKEIQEIVGECKKTKCKLKILPGILELIDGQVSISKLRDVDIEDLLGRDEVQVDLKEISDYLNNKIVLVTGGGGSIGSELCRQIAAFEPKKLIALDIYENGVFEVQNEMRIKYPELDFEAVIASIRDSLRIKEIFSKHVPHVVFHAAAHKHVPLMEANPKEAVMNNVLGTKILADMAHEYGIEKFVLISTDKAVNPCNVMGATKRAAEMIIQAKSKTSKTQFSAVRFGNVLGSNGSVIPLFRKQIEEGGPVTVTHPEVTRYFMTIPEAVQLVIQAGAMADGGEIFILDMGQPVRIMELAENIIQLSGYRPYEDIEIKITGLRPGEKLYEELMLEEEGVEKTVHEKIYIGKPLEIDEEQLNAQLERISELLMNGEDELKEFLSEMVPTYKMTAESE